MEKYNANGEWRPICFSGDIDGIQRQIRTETDDERIRGLLFYIRTTGFKVIEFVLRGEVVLPGKNLDLPNSVHLYPLSDDPNQVGLDEEDWTVNRYIYDGWIPVIEDTAESVNIALDEINWTMGLMSQIYKCSIHWTLKYPSMNHGAGDALIDDSHTGLLEKVLSSTYLKEDRVRLQSALDWIAHARRLRSPFNRFLAYWIAMEGIAFALYDGSLFPEKKIAKTVGRASTWERVKKAFFYVVGKISAIKAAEEASNTEKVKASLQTVFGNQSAVINRVFREKAYDGSTLAKIRHKIAHGEFMEWNMTHVAAVHSALPMVEKVTTEFVMRLLLDLAPNQALPQTGHSMRLIIEGSDPRGTMVCSDLRMLPAKSWRIQSKWITEQ